MSPDLSPEEKDRDSYTPIAPSVVGPRSRYRKTQHRGKHERMREAAMAKKISISDAEGKCCRINIGEHRTSNASTPERRMAILRKHARTDAERYDGMCEDGRQEMPFKRSGPAFPAPTR